MFAGIDLGAEHLHCVAIGPDRSIVDARVFSDVDATVDWAARAEQVAIDAPATLSTAPHASEDGLSPKFRHARCAEVALGRGFGVWVPWTTPIEESLAAAWMRTGFRLFASLRSRGADPVEVYPYGAFRYLAGQRPGRKQSAAGAALRVALLRKRGVSGGWLEMWSHDGLDALMAALIAADRAAGKAVPVGCGHDGSAIWLPSAS